ncbi:MAG: alpha/beta hydrolase-fold protein [Verrucomicrobiota bacterium]
MRVIVPLLILSVSAFALDIPKPGPDSVVQSGVPQGDVTKRVFAKSQIFPGTTRDYWVYVPKQYTADKPANLIVFQDGGGYVKTDGAFKAPVVLDNLIAKGELPVTVAVFVSPGSVTAGKTGAVNRSNRSFEYDSLGDRYVRFLLEEFLPEALQGVNVTSDPAGRGIVGSSSGGICAFTAAWERPDQFGKVFSSIGSFTNIRGGYVYPALIRKSKSAPKPLRVYLVDGESDVNNLHGHWPLSNEDMGAALSFAGYDYHLEMTGGGHSGQAAGAMLPDVLRWLWRPNSQ